MSYLLPEESNPFQAPKARIGGVASQFEDADLQNAELIRREHIGLESSVKSLGTLQYLGCFFCCLATVLMFAMASGAVPMGPQNNQALPPETMRYLFGGIGVLYLFLSVISGCLGYGLRRFQVWARWTTLVLTGISLMITLVNGLVVAVSNPAIGLISVAAGSLIPGYIVYLMITPKAGMVFSPEYKTIILQTPHVKPKTSLLTKIILILIVAIILFVVVAGLMAPRN